MEENQPDHEIAAANERFYQALEQSDLELMRDVWLHGDHVLCAHPGRATLQGWASVWDSWEAILGSGGNPQVILTEVSVVARGSTAWVSAVENMLSGGHTGAAIALNIFEFDGQSWKMVAHHSGPIAA